MKYRLEKEYVPKENKYDINSNRSKKRSIQNSLKKSSKFLQFVYKSFSEEQKLKFIDKLWWSHESLSVNITPDMLLCLLVDDMGLISESEGRMLKRKYVIGKLK
jgi:hypothetical protein